jgi:hypothetical protein
LKKHLHTLLIEAELKKKLIEKAERERKPSQRR